MSKLLVVDSVSKCFSRGGECIVALDNVSLHINQGEIVMVVGGPLDGKTSLLRIASTTTLPDRGTVSLEGRTLTSLPDRHRAKLLGRDIMWINREGSPLGVEISRFVGWPLALHGLKRRQAERAADQILARVGLGEHTHRQWGDLSDRQRVLAGLARVFAGSPKLIVIDDLLNGLGGTACEETIDLIRSLVGESPHNPGILLSVSEMETTAYADRVLSIHKGSVEAMTGLPENDAHVVPLRESLQAES